MKATSIAIILTCLMVPRLHAVEYKEQEQREIKSLSFEDIESIKTGKGWGMAKPAELNGYPGPSHVLDLAEELNLSAKQYAKIKSLFVQMQEVAISVGERYLKAERRLDEAFRSKEISPNVLKELIGISAQTQAELRHVHLSTHLEMVRLLATHQISNYNQLRGYAGAPTQHHMH